jgi:hypothetical protein
MEGLTRITWSGLVAKIFAKQVAGRIFMHSLKSAARRRGRKASSVLLAVLFLFISLHSEAAFSASLMVTIKQINPDSAIQRVTCAERQLCLLPIAIQTQQGQNETVNVSTTFTPGNLTLLFPTPQGDLFAGDKGATNGHYSPIWHISVAKDKPSTHDITLFVPVSPSVGGAPKAVVPHPTYNPVATIEITTQPAP